MQRNLFLYGFRCGLPSGAAFAAGLLHRQMSCRSCVGKIAYLIVRRRACRFFVTMFMAVVTATLFLRTNLHPDSVTSANNYFGVVFFSLISLLFDGFAEETITVLHPACCAPFLALFLLVAWDHSSGHTGNESD